MKQVEDRFNHWAHYDYVFLNDEVSGTLIHACMFLANRFSLSMMNSRSMFNRVLSKKRADRLRYTQRLTSSKCSYGLIEPDHWHQPDWWVDLKVLGTTYANLARIDEEKATKAREDMVRKKVIYGHSVPYRNMCRFNSGVSNDRFSCEDGMLILSSSTVIPCWQTMTTTGESSRPLSSSVTLVSAPSHYLTQH